MKIRERQTDRQKEGQRQDCRTGDSDWLKMTDRQTEGQRKIQVCGIGDSD